MTLASLGGFLALAAAAAYIQTVTGFAFGLLMLAGIGLFRWMPLPVGSIMVGVLVLFNSGQVLLLNWRDVALREALLMLCFSLVAMVGGYTLLTYLAAESLDTLRLILGVVVIGAATQLIVKPHPFAKRSSNLAFAAAGTVAGVMSGLFAAAGPPLIYLMYRQPFPMARIRNTLMMVFAISAVMRLVLVTASGDLPSGPAWWPLAAAPAVMAATYAAGRWPPPLSTTALRRCAFVLLMLTGVVLAGPAVLKIAGLSA